ncbi:MAG TPA: class I SAM-dependent methyltransferase [Allosphingosinicella sp.]|nr:class I SAM-dependent methyltransferase [Allosphingosinicella sp.]
MDFADPIQRATFFALHSGLPREGPGDRTSTERALGLVPRLPQAPEVLDVGCGPGGQTIDLAELLPDARIAALDNHAPFLRELERRALARGVAERIRAVEGDMALLPFEPGSFDLVWCEGAAYVIGLETALATWKPLLREGGAIALTEPVWLTDRPPERAAAFWAAYPAMRDRAGVRAVARDCGYRIAGEFVLPEEAWWTDYYGPIEARLTDMERSPGDPAAAIVLEEAREEIECYRRHPDCYSYLFIVLET